MYSFISWGRAPQHLHGGPVDRRPLHLGRLGAGLRTIAITITITMTITMTITITITSTSTTTSTITITITVTPRARASCVIVYHIISYHIMLD